MGKAAFTKGTAYKMKHRIGRSVRLMVREYVYIGSRGSKHHFYDQWNGVDVLLTTAEANDCILKAKEVSND